MKYSIICLAIIIVFITKISAQNGVSEKAKSNSIGMDLGRSLVGTYLGAGTGAGIGGFFPLLFYAEKNELENQEIFLPYFPGLYLGASIGSALGASLFLHLSKKRDIGYWKLAGYSLLPSVLSSIPLSLAAAVNRNDRNIRIAGTATLISAGVTMIWSVLLYRYLLPSNPAGKRKAVSPAVSIFPGQIKFPARNSRTPFYKMLEVRF